MFSRAHPVLLQLSLVLALTSCMGIRVTHEAAQTGPASHTTKAPAANDDVPQMERWLRDLRSPDENQRATAKKAIIALAGESASSRQYVVGELLKIIAVGDKRAELMMSPERYLEWKEAAEIIGNINATEATDELVECLDCNNGFAGVGPGRFPALMAVTKFGDAAVPKLARALEQKPPAARFRAAQALYVIGSDAAKAALKKALIETKDKQFAAQIKTLLRNWKGPSGGRADFASY